MPLAKSIPMKIPKGTSPLDPSESGVTGVWERSPNRLLSIALMLAAISGCFRPHSSGDATIDLAFQLQSNSMAPSLWGPRSTGICPKCSQTWLVARETLSSQLPLSCPSCGTSECQVKHPVAGLCVLASAATSEQPIQRWQCVVFRGTQQVDEQAASSAQSELQVKRVLGLPGETIEMRDGEVWINQRKLQKCMDQLRQLAVLVSQFPGDARSDWYQVDISAPLESLVAVEKLGQFSEPTRLEWRHRNWLDITGPVSSTGPHAYSAVLNDYCMNHSTSMNLVPVSDLLMTIQLSDDSDQLANQPHASHASVRETHLRLQCRYLGVQYTADLFLGASNDARLNLAEFAKGELVYADESPKQISMGGWDGRVWLQMNGVTPVELRPATDYAPSEDQSENATRFSIELLSGKLSIDRLTVHRDLYLQVDQRDLRNGLHAPVRLPENHYFVIGDNLPISIDSRNGLGLIDRSRIIAVVSNDTDS
ncbi:MAG TPA: hypothetical protein DCF63_10155 [Planctomycetaceae bacterium]|nr:hypothetical protein [Planctomycetaceae bacterium]